MAGQKRQFDRNKYLNSPHAELSPEQAARAECARERAVERARRMRPIHFWLRAVAGLAVTIGTWVLIGWWAEWSAVRTGVWLTVGAVIWIAGTVASARWFYRLRR